MIVRLQHLSARAPSLADLQAVASLWTTCTDSTHYNEEEVHQRWQTTSFQLHADAWVVVTRQNDIVAYADICRETHLGAFVTSIYVHPDQRERGIAMLLLLLVEQRLRHFMDDIPLSQKITLTSTVRNIDNHTCTMFVREGYICQRRFSRVTVARKEGAFVDPLHIDLLIDDDSLLGNDQGVQDCEVYVKVLRSAQEVAKVLSSTQADQQYSLV